VIAAGAQSPWAKRRRLEFAESADQPWVLPPPETVIDSIAREAFRAVGLDYPRTSVVAIPPEVRISLLANGRFLTILPASALRFPVVRPEIKVLPVELPTTHVPNGIVTMKNRTLSPVAQSLIDKSREVANALAKRRS
jgi:DNA-binding transcriptional LysR family regulator